MSSCADYWQQAVSVPPRRTQVAFAGSAANTLAGNGAPCPSAIPDDDPVDCAALPLLAPAAKTTSLDLRNGRQV
jgi:hypothetical protein